MAPLACDGSVPLDASSLLAQAVKVNTQVQGTTVGADRPLCCEWHPLACQLSEGIATVPPSVQRHCQSASFFADSIWRCIIDQAQSVDSPDGCVSIWRCIIDQAQSVDSPDGCVNPMSVSLPCCGWACWKPGPTSLLSSSRRPWRMLSLKGLVAARMVPCTHADCHVLPRVL